MATSASSELPVQLELQDGIALLTFNRPEAMNAINEAIATGFLAACEQIAADDSVRVIVLRGAGRSFVAGGDLSFLDQQPLEVAARLIAPMHRGLALLAAHQAPVLASVHGSAAGAGLSLVLAADLAIAAEGTRFNMAYIGIGASSDLGASWSLAHAAGPKRAMELALLNPVIDAAQAQALGIINRVVAAETLDEATAELARKLAALPQPAAAEMKLLIRTAPERSFVAQLDQERAAFHRCAGSPDFTSRVRAFFSKRPAKA